MGTPRPHLSRHVSGRAPRRGRRPRRPVFRSPIAGCTRVLLFCLRRPYFFQQRKKYGKERRQKPTVFGFPFRPIVTAVQKGSAPNRLHSYPRCRSCVPRGGARRSRQLSLNWHRCRSCVPRENFLLSCRAGEVLYILHNFVFCGPKGRTYTCRRRRQVRDLIIATVVDQRTSVRNVGAAAIRGLQAIRCTTICSGLGFRVVHGSVLYHAQPRRKS